MSTETDRWPLDPIDRSSEGMVGLLRALTVTGTMSVALGAGATVREILIAALGCTIAWGKVDATVSLLTTATERGRGRAQAAAIRTAPCSQAKAPMRAFLPGGAGDAMRQAQVGAVLGRMRDNPPETDAEPVLQWPDVKGAGRVFVPVTRAPFPPVLPLVLVDPVPLLMRLSNVVAIARFIVIGRRPDRQMQGGRPPMRWMIPVIGLAMMAITIGPGG
jgi:hypothetical protein